MAPLRAALSWIARSPARAFLIIFLLGLSIRVFYLTRVPQGWIAPRNLLGDLAIARALVETGQFADPYLIPTGPTAHLPPLVPGIVALLWMLFGTGLVGGYAVWVFNLTAYATLYALLPWFGEKLGLGREAGVLGGLAGAVIVLRPGHGEELAGIVVGLLALVFLRRWTKGLGSFGGSLLLGGACGVAFHLQPVLLPVVLGWMAFELWWSRDRRRWRLSAGVVVGMALACAPWGWRNYAELDDVFFVRSNLGLELRMAHHDGAAGHLDVIGARGAYRHPSAQRAEAQLVRELGEAEYMRRAQREAVDWIRSHPAEALRLTTSRVVQFWFGPLHRPGIFAAVTSLTLLALLGARRSLPAMTCPQRAALVTPLICYPLIYYVVAFEHRYRVPVEWILLLLAGAAVWGFLRAPEGSGGTTYPVSAPNSSRVSPEPTRAPQEGDG